MTFRHSRNVRVWFQLGVPALFPAILVHSTLGGKRNGRVILLEAVIQPGNQPDLAKLMDLEMLMMPGGRERTADDCRALFARAGLTLTRIVPTESPLCVIEARP
jgi:O-methyltransferase